MEVILIIKDSIFQKTRIMSKYANLEKEKSPLKDCYYGDEFGGCFRKKQRPFALKVWKNNFYKPICEDVLTYFEENNISWWGGKQPTQHILSSQIACVNHLFLLRNNKKAVLSIAKKINQDIDDVLLIQTDKKPTYISFEVVSDNDYLNEGTSTRGSNCTSIDALIAGKIKDKTILLPIEWKYTEFYANTDKSKEDSSKDSPDYKKGDEAKGKIRLSRYTDLLNKSEQLKHLIKYRESVYFFEPFYQLMRQTLWAEQMISNKDSERIKTDDYIHVHVIPEQNTDLLSKKYPVSGKNMETTWRDCLCAQEKYQIISPKELLADIDLDNEESKLLFDYLKTRYWDE